MLNCTIPHVILNLYETVRYRYWFSFCVNFKNSISEWTQQSFTLRQWWTGFMEEFWWPARIGDIRKLESTGFFFPRPLKHASPPLLLGTFFTFVFYIVFVKLIRFSIIFWNFSEKGLGVQPYMFFRGLRKLAMKHLSYGIQEMYKGIYIGAQVKQLQKFVPSLRPQDVSRCVLKIDLMYLISV